MTPKRMSESEAALLLQGLGDSALGAALRAHLLWTDIELGEGATPPLREEQAKVRKVQSELNGNEYEAALKERLSWVRSRLQQMDNRHAETIRVLCELELKLLVELHV